MKFKLPHFFFLSIGILSCIASFGQNAPNWLDENIRNMLYPKEDYFVGYAFSSAKNENVNTITERLKSEAQSNLLESIHVDMKTNSQAATISETINGSYYENEQFLNQTEKSTSAEIVGMKTESYYQANTKIVHAFAYVKREDVASYHKNLLISNLNRADGIISSIQQLYANNDKAAAREQCAALQDIFAKIHQSQNILIAVCKQNSENDLQQNHTKELYENYVKLQSQLDPKYEIIENLHQALTQKIVKIESSLQTANDFVRDGEKAKARQQCEFATRLLNDVRSIQDSMRKTFPAITIDDIEQKKTEKLNNEVSIMSAQLEQGVIIFFESTEDAFGKNVSVISSKLKSQMSNNGCSFTDDVSKADFKLTLNAETREGSTMDNLVFCYADVSIDLFDTHKGKSVYNDNISEKGGSTTADKAARKAMENAANSIMKNIESWIK